MHQGSGARRAAAKKEKQTQSKAPGETVCSLDGLPLLPEFHLVLGPEPDANGQLKSSEQEHIEALLAQYQQEEGIPQVPPTF
jgi:hypothetical protein